MIKIIEKLKNIFKRGLTPYEAKGFRSGFVILFTVVLSAIILSIALGITSISLREIKFGTSTKDANEAFFATDVGAECALYYDRSDPTKNAFTGSALMNCAGNPITLTGSSPLWSFIVSRLGSDEQGCAKVTVEKTIVGTTTFTEIISSGYNNGGGGLGSCVQGSNTVERQLEINYSS